MIGIHANRLSDERHRAVPTRIRSALCGQRGAVMLSLVASMIFISVLSAAVVQLNSSDQVETVVGNQGLNAYYLAESGYRFAAKTYLYTENQNDDFSADDDKARALKDEIDSATVNLANNQGTFKLRVRPYWFISESAQPGPNITVRLPGDVGDMIHMPATGILKISDDVGVAEHNYTNGTMNANGTFTCNIASGSVDKDDNVYLAFRPRSNQQVTDGATLRLKDVLSDKVVPAKNGKIMLQKGAESVFYKYQNVTFNANNNVLRLNGLKEIPGGTGTGPVSVTQASTVVFKKFLKLTAQGSTGTGHLSAQRNVDYYVYLSDSAPEPPPQNYTFWDPTHWTDPRGYITTAQVINAGGYRHHELALMRNGDIGTENGKQYKHYTTWWNRTSTIHDAWIDNDHLLDYDVQVKIGTGNDLLFGAFGLTIRGIPVGSDYEGLGVSFMSYHSPNSTIAGGAAGDPHENYNDLIPDSIKPLGLVDDNNDPIETGSVITWQANCTENEQWRCVDAKDTHILLVLWERINGNFRWLAYKDVTHDTYVIGSQDWPAFPTNGHAIDGHIVNDNATLLLRVREKRVQHLNNTVKVNEIGVFYGDASQVTGSGARFPTTIAYDITDHRDRYNPDYFYNNNSPFPTWPPRNLKYWSISIDYYSHLEEPLNLPAFQWDAINTSVNSPTIFELLPDGTIRISDLTTPDGIGGGGQVNNYRVNEVGMHGFGDMAWAGRQFQIGGFDDFSWRAYKSGHLYGGFEGVVQD